MNKFWLTVMVLLISVSLAAQEVELRQDHPDEYVVQEGDTLWEIAGRFLTRPWQWPAIWQANPQVENPHLIFPGDRLSLIYVDGQPRLVVDRESRLSPGIRRTPITEPVTAVPFSVVEPFLVHPRQVGLDELPRLPYVVANEETRFASAKPYRSYVRGLEGFRPGDHVVLARLAFQLEEVEVEGRTTVRQNRMRRNLGAVPVDERPIAIERTLNPFARKGRVAGYQLWEVARAEVLTAPTDGEPAQIEVLGGRLEVQTGDYVLPIDPHIYDLTFVPRPPEGPIPAGASVIGINGGETAISHYQIVTLDVGRSHGFEAGHVVSVFNSNREVRDEFVGGLRGRPGPANVSGNRVQLPPQYIGQAMVFRVFDRVSYALIMTGNRAVREGDLIDQPDRRL
ncbi:MAG: LysM peptidoglycan-binding domain-containing protein [Wenzhouxiangellaceae bacterium]